MNLVISCLNDSIKLDNRIGNEATEKKSVIKGKSEQNNEEEKTEKLNLQQLDRQDLVAVERASNLFVSKKAGSRARARLCILKKKNL